MIGKLLHWWRLLVEPDTSLVGVGGRWRVRYEPTSYAPISTISIPMTYRQACNYAAMFKGSVERVPVDAAPTPG